MINVHIQAAQARRPLSVRRIGPRVFWSLLVIEFALLVGAFAWLLPWALPQRTPQSVASTASLRVRDAIADRLSGAVSDPLVELAPGETVRASNLRGLSLDGTTYYYYVEGRANYDPLSTGLVRPSQIQPLLRDDAGPAPITIYTING